jgi:GDPmannose 4,6-dehydratase
MWLMLQQDSSDDYVVGTGVGATVRDFCNATFSALDLDYKDYVETEEKYLRPTEVDALIAKPDKANDVLGWKAETHWQKLANLMVLADLDALKKISTK